MNQHIKNNSGESQVVAREKPVQCPCCKQVVAVPSFEIICDHLRLRPKQAAILGAVWNRKGHPATAEQIFDAMYADDPNGGPSNSAMYRTLKVELCHLRKKLEGYGFAIENVGHHQGWRLVIEGSRS